MSKVIDAPEALELLARAVAEKGANYKYEQVAVPMPIDPDPWEDEAEEVEPDTYKTCVYVDNEGNPSCVVGHVLSYTVPEVLPKIQQWEREDNDTTFGTVASELELPFTEAAVRTLRAAQIQQDIGSTWGDALERAKEAAEAELRLREAQDREARLG